MPSSISVDFVTSEDCQLGTSRLVYTAESTKGKVIAGPHRELGFVDRPRPGSSSPGKEQRLLGINGLDDAFEKAWAACTAVYNEEFKTQASMKEVRESVMAGHIYGEDLLLPRPAVEHRLTRRGKQKE